ncbi:MAG: hypothetical protein NVSMB21_01670 [Vulcanimicrobiaceae bacterium]
MPALRLLAAQLAIGAAAIFARYALAGAGPLAVSALRLTIAATVALAIARRLRPLAPRRELAFAVAGLALALHFATWIGSLAYTSVALSTLLVTTTPMWTELYDVVRLGRPPTPGYVVALVLALVGVAALAFGGPGPAPQPGHAVLGAVLALAGSFAIGAYLLMVRDASAYPDGTRVSTRAFVTRTYGWAALALGIAAVAARQGPPRATDLSAWGGVLAMALVSQLLGHTALNAALRDFSPSTIALTTLLEPVIAALLAAALFGERLGTSGLVGGVLIVSAVGITLRRGGDADPR